jgi:hypothetical protein
MEPNGSLERTKRQARVKAVRLQREDEVRDARLVSAPGGDSITRGGGPHLFRRLFPTSRDRHRELAGGVGSAKDPSEWWHHLAKHWCEWNLSTDGRVCSKLR